MSKFRWRAMAAALVMTAMAAWIAVAQVPPQAPAAGQAPQTPAPPPAAATVGPRRIAQAELDARAQQALADYKGRTGSELPPEVQPLMRRQLLESLIRRELLVLEAQRRGVVGSEQEAEAQIKRDPFFQVNGRFDPTRYEQVKLQNPAAFQASLREFRANLGARDLLQKLQAEKGPPEAQLKPRMTRALTHATLDYLVLRRGDFDGSFPEPREREVLEYYQAHAAEYARPDRATLSVAFLDQPALSDSEAAIPTAVAAWSARMKRSADSVLAAVTAGRKLEDAAQAFGGVRGNQVVVPGNFPGYWRGDAAAGAEVFKAAAGATLPHAVPAAKGWLVVRVDEVQPAHTQALREVSRDIRSRLRAERRATHEESELKAVYEGMRDSLKTTAYRVRYGVADTATIVPGQPSEVEIDHFYHGHLADYSTFDSRSGGVVAKSLEQVRAEVIVRLQREGRFEVSRSLADQLAGIWAKHRRDAALERRLQVTEAGTVVPGTPADGSAVGAMLGDSLALRQGQLGPGLARTARGWVAFDVYEAVPGYVPTLDQARSEVQHRRAWQRIMADEDGAKRLFDRDPARFSEGPVVHFSRAFVPIPPVLTIRQTRAEVERFYRAHLDRFTAPELVRASHILISPRDGTPAADREARARADSLLERLRAGEDFAEMAAKVTDDPATRDNGGDLGVFGRGTMLPEVERAAFSMRPGDLSPAPVRSPVGYHLLKAREYVPMVAQPLPQIWADVAEAAAQEKADSLAQRRADSLLLVLPTAERARAAAKQLNLATLAYEHVTGERAQYPQDLQGYFQRLEGLRPGQVLGLHPKFGGMGYAVTWVDSITPPQAPRFAGVHDKVLEAYRAGAGERAMLAKRAELDSLSQAGWSFDSLGAYWGGLQHAQDIAPGDRIPGIGAVASMDTLLFGRTGSDGLAPGRVSDWITLPAGITRVRLLEVHPPDASALTTRVESERRVETERALLGYFDELKQRYPVKILDRKLRDVALPQPPPAR